MADRLPLPLWTYLALARRAGAVFHLINALRVRSGKDDGARRHERFGRASRARPAGAIVWIHAASVGETMSVLPLIDALVDEGLQVVLTTVTRTSAELAEQRLPEGAWHQFACYDHPNYIEAFLDHWQPGLALIVESEVWPSAFLTLQRRGLPFVLVNGRMSSKSFGTWSLVPKSARRIFGCLTMALAQSAADCERLAALGVARVEEPGNLKFDGTDLPVDETARQAIAMDLSDRPVWLAALTHPGEEEVVLAAHKALLNEHPDLLLLLVPRHPSRTEGVADMCAQAGLTAARRSLFGRISPGTQVFLGDTIGEMGLFYSLSQTVFLGGSFAPVGGHNPLEPLRCGVALMTGPKVANARSTYASLWQADAAIRLDSPDALAGTVRLLLRDPQRRMALARRGQAVIEASAGAVGRTLEALRPYFPVSSGRRAP